jgi:hypothetical protein
MVAKNILNRPIPVLRTGEVGMLDCFTAQEGQYEAKITIWYDARVAARNTVGAGAVATAPPTPPAPPAETTADGGVYDPEDENDAPCPHTDGYLEDEEDLAEERAATASSGSSPHMTAPKSLSTSRCCAQYRRSKRHTYVIRTTTEQPPEIHIRRS